MTKRMKDETEDEIDASWISAHSFQALIINFGSLREYVNGFELPRLKEANIRGRERYVQSLHQLVLQHGLDHESTVRPLEADFFLTFRILSTILSLGQP